MNKLRRSRYDRSVFGVCGGIAEFFDISSTAVRILFVFVPSGLVIYFVLAAIVPEE